MDKAVWEGWTVEYAPVDELFKWENKVDLDDGLIQGSSVGGDLVQGQYVIVRDPINIALRTKKVRVTVEEVE